MKKQALSFVVMLGLLATLSAVSVSGQQARLMTATIPFDFTIGQKTLPAGKYSVERTSTRDALLLRGEDNRGRVIFVTQSTIAKRMPEKARLEFRRYGDQYFLGSVWSPGTDIGRELSPSRRERELVKDSSKHLALNAAEPEIVYVAAQ